MDTSNTDTTHNIQNTHTRHRLAATEQVKCIKNSSYKSDRIEATRWFKYAVPWSNLEAEYLFYMFKYIKFDLTNKQAVGS